MTVIGRTAEILASSRNRAVLELIRGGLVSSKPEVRVATIRAAVRRHENAIHTQLIRQFGVLGEADRLVLCEAHGTMPHHASPALKSVILEGDATLCANACQIIALSADADLF